MYILPLTSPTLSYLYHIVTGSCPLSYRDYLYTLYPSIMYCFKHHFTIAFELFHLHWFWLWR